MCIEVHARFSACPHSHLVKWTYCSISACHVPASGRVCRKYRRKIKSSESGRARECAECTMDHKIAEQFGKAVLISVRDELGEATCGEIQEEPNAKKRRFWHRKDNESGEEVPIFSPRHLGTWAWSVMAKAPVNLPREDSMGLLERRGQKRGPSRHDSALLHNQQTPSPDDRNRSQGSGVWNWCKSSLGGCG